MKITLEQLMGCNACDEGLKYFEDNFGEEADTDEIINKLLDEKTTASWLSWLADKFKLSTVFKRWYENGRLKEECCCKNGEQDGAYKWWFANGQLGSECYYKNGELDGAYKRWRENGQLNEE